LNSRSLYHLTYTITPLAITRNGNLDSDKVFVTFLTIIIFMSFSLPSLYDTYQNIQMYEYVYLHTYTYIHTYLYYLEFTKKMLDFSKVSFGCFPSLHVCPVLLRDFLFLDKRSFGDLIQKSLILASFYFNFFCSFQGVYG